MHSSGDSEYHRHQAPGTACILRDAVGSSRKNDELETSRIRIDDCSSNFVVARAAHISSQWTRQQRSDRIRSGAARRAWLLNLIDGPHRKRIDTQ